MKLQLSRTFKRMVSAIVAVLVLPAAMAQNTQYDFAYRSSDHRVNVFDDGRDTRLQLPEGTLVPTVVVLQPRGEVVLKSQREDPYLVIPGVHQQIRLRWANSREVAISYTGIAGVNQRLGQAASFGSAAPVASHGSVAAPIAVAQGAAVAVPSTSDRTAAMPAWTAAQGTPVASAASAAPVVTYAVSRADRTVRETLQRWSKEAGWTFGDEHWTLGVDMPIVASASLGTDFKGAVRALLSSTQLADLPVQPCFYNGNQVLRVVPKAERCDRM